jgi:myosin-3
VGDILIAVNPFRDLGLYGGDMASRYCNVASKKDHPPHLFAIADSAYHSMMRNGKSQVSVNSCTANDGVFSAPTGVIAVASPAAH